MRTWGGRFSEDHRQARSPISRARSRSTRARRRRPRRLDRPRPRAGPGRAPDRRRGRASWSRGSTALAEDVAAGRIDVGPRPRGRPHEPRGGAGRAGRAGGRTLHTGRSRNDQVATDLRLWTRRADRRPRRRDSSASSARSSGSPSATATPSCPGTTHIQPAQPVLFAHHLLAYVEMAERDRGRLADARRRLNVSPLGAGALAGAGYPLDREATARRARLRRRHRELARRGLRPRLRRRDPGGRRARDGPPEPAGRGDHLVVEPAVRVRARRRRVLDRQLDDAQQEEPRSRRAGPRPRGPRHRGADRRASRCSRACRSPTSATSRRTRRRCSTRSRVYEASLRRDGRAGRRRSTVDVGADAPRRRRGLHDGHGRRRRARPARRRRSGPPTTSSARSSPRPRRAGLGLDAVADAMIGLALGAAGDDTTAALAADPGIGDALRAAASLEARSRRATSSAARRRRGSRRRSGGPRAARRGGRAS